LREIGNALGMFIWLDPSTLTCSARNMCDSLVGIDLHEGLLETIDIEWSGRLISERLDYVGISFHCSLCMDTRHLQRDCIGKHAVEKDKEENLREDPPQYVLGDDAIERGPIYYESHSSEETDSLIGMLKSIYPLFFNSLSCWER